MAFNWCNLIGAQAVVEAGSKVAAIRHRDASAAQHDFVIVFQHVFRKATPQGHDDCARAVVLVHTRTAYFNHLGA